MYGGRNKITHCQKQVKQVRVIPHLRAKPSTKPQRTLLKKTLWITSVLASVALCTWQLAICLQKYFQQPIGTTVRVEGFSNYTLPGLTLCPATYQITYDFTAQFDAHCQQHDKCTSLSEHQRERMTFDELGISLLDLWHPKTNMTVSTDNQCGLAINWTKCNSTDWIQRGLVDTIAGPCHTFQTDVLWHFVGKSWVYWIEVTNISDLPVEAFSVGVFTSTSPNLMFISQAFITNDSYNDLEVSATTFEYLNTTRNPCSTEEELYQCTNQWFTPQLHSPDIKCRWPLINSSALPLCNSMFQVNELQSKLIKLLFSWENTEVCKRLCRATTFSLTRINGVNAVGTHKTVISLTLKSNTRVIVSEYFAYPFSSLIAEVGGSIGLFLGISLLSCLNSLLGILK